MDIYDNGDNRGRGYTDDVTAGAVDGDDIRGLKLVVSCKYDVGVWDNRDKAGGVDDVSTTAVDGGDKGKRKDKN